MMTVLLTGASGFLGKKLNQELLDEGFHIVSLKEDLTEELSEYCVDIVIHAAGLVDLSRDFDVGKHCLHVNTLGTMNLLKSLRNHHPKFFLYVSSEEIYGEGPIPFKEDQIPNPPSPYAVSKLSAEYLCSWYGKEYAVPVCIVRLGTFYGPEQPHNKYFAQVILRALKNQPIPCNSGQKKRDYIYIDDAVDLIIRCVRKKQEGIFNGTGGKSYRLLDVISFIKELTKSTSEIKIGEIPDRMTERDEWLSDISKAKNILGWEPKISLEEGLRRTIVWFQKNR